MFCSVRFKLRYISALGPILFLFKIQLPVIGEDFEEDFVYKLIRVSISAFHTKNSSCILGLDRI